MIPEPRLEKLYQDVILDHNKTPRNYKVLENPTQYSHGVNPLCGDDYHLYLKVDALGKIEDIGFQGSGCAISKSSASMMTSFIKGKQIDEVEKIKQSFLELLTKDNVSQDAKDAVGRLILFQGVKDFPVRVKCATLIWHTLNDALNDIKGGKS